MNDENISDRGSVVLKDYIMMTKKWKEKDRRQQNI